MAATMKNTMAHSLFSLENKTVVLTGASGYLGAAMARGLAGAGAELILQGRDVKRLKQCAEAAQNLGSRVHTIEADIATADGCAELIDFVADRIGHLDVLINNAYSGEAATVASSTREQFESAYGLAVTTAFDLVQKALPLFERGVVRSKQSASVINIATMYATVSPDPRIYGDSGQNNPPFYGAAKAGLLQLTRYLACHLAPQQIRVNAISPGPFPSGNLQESDPAFYQTLCSKTPMNRIGLADEIVGPVLFLASNAASYITGANIAVDGGWTAW
jgi:NAD(P)-dependent dehydrogenase (short-subunit alcohol dehydrogenase family)